MRHEGDQRTTRERNGEKEGKTGKDEEERV